MHIGLVGCHAAEQGNGTVHTKRGRRAGASTRATAWSTASVVASTLMAALGCSTAVHFARRVLTPALPDQRVVVTGIESGAHGRQVVWLNGPDTELPGRYSFIFDVRSREEQHLAGHARLGEVVDSVGRGAARRVARELVSIDRGELRVGTRGRVTGWWYSDPRDLGLAVRRVSLPLPGGVSWAWLFEPSVPASGKWAVHVHGRGALPEETLRGVQVSAELGYRSLVIAYRNDPGAPQGHRSRYGLGLSEWRDVDAAIGWAIAQGAEEVSLFGWSMGATAVILAAGLGMNSSKVTSMVLDSPALDWRGILMQQARLARLPRAVARLAMVLLRCGLVAGGVENARHTDLGSLTPRTLGRMIRVPTLIHASPDDTFVPWDGAIALAQMRSRLVRFRVASGEHVKLWNVDAHRWEAETASFLRFVEQHALDGRLTLAR